MYLVVSHWEALPGKASDFEKIGIKMRETLRAQPGVELVEAFRTDGRVTVVHGYRDEATYHSVVDNADGPFQRAMAETHLEEYARWLDSERGQSV